VLAGHAKEEKLKMVILGRGLQFDQKFCGGVA